MSPDLLYRFNQGDIKAFEEVYRSYRWLPFTVMKSFHLCKEDKEDITTNIFVKLFTGRKQFDSVEGIKNWLVCVAKNEAINRLGFIKRSPFVCLEFDIAAEEVGNELIKHIYHKIESLPVQCRCIFKMLYVEGLTVPEAAQRLGVAPQTIRNQKTRAIQLLRKRLQHAL